MKYGRNALVAGKKQEELMNLKINLDLGK